MLQKIGSEGRNLDEHTTRRLDLYVMEIEDSQEAKMTSSSVPGAALFVKMQ